MRFSLDRLWVTAFLLLPVILSCTPAAERSDQLAERSDQLAELGGKPDWPDPPVKLLILGTFHFQDAGLDSYRPDHDIDILSPERQHEVEEMVRRLVEFQSNKVAVEWPPSDQSYLDSLYQIYREGDLELPSDETFQLGFRVAAELGHGRLHAVDAKRRFYEPWVDPDEYAEKHGQEEWLDPDLWEIYERHHKYNDLRKTKTTLSEHLIYLNEPEQLYRSHGQYVIGNFEVGGEGDFPGVDAKTAWYNRNLKIFANIQRIADFDGDRVLLIIGNGHVPILRHVTQASPQFELEEVESVLGG